MSSSIYANSLPLPQLTASQINNLSNSINTITLSSSNVFSTSYAYASGMHPEVKKYEIYETPQDVLALSVAWKRLREDGTAQGNISSLLDRRLFEVLTSDDHANATVIRDYYSKKVVLWKLKGDRLSSYREDMNKFVHSDGTKLRENMLGLAYYIPSFYEYDTQLDEVRLQVVSKQIPLTAQIDSKKLKPLKRIIFKNKRASNIQYWFQDTRTDCAVLITVDTKNPLDHMWKHMFETSSILNISGTYGKRNRDNFEYFSVNSWTLA